MRLATSQSESVGAAPISSLAGLRVAGDLYRGDLAREHPWVSPINADLVGLPPVMLFSGTRDVCNPAARQLCERAAAAGVDVDFHEGIDLVHVYPLLPCDEGVDARQTIADALIASSRGAL
ncbi:alpha/beta hydrolase [Mycobacterium intracellulare]|nr:alpha/beta hydrolase [Mycobacterium intracellulare]